MGPHASNRTAAMLSGRSRRGARTGAAVPIRGANAHDRYSGSTTGRGEARITDKLRNTGVSAAARSGVFTSGNPLPLPSGRGEKTSRYLTNKTRFREDNDHWARPGSPGAGDNRFAVFRPIAEQGSLLDVSPRLTSRYGMDGRRVRRTHWKAGGSGKGGHLLALLPVRAGDACIRRRRQRAGATVGRWRFGGGRAHRGISRHVGGSSVVSRKKENIEFPHSTHGGRHQLWRI